MINTKETCELVNSSQIRNYIVNYLIKYNSKDFIDFISANPNKRKVFISFDYNIDFKPSTFVLRTATDYHTSLGLVACYAVAMPPRKVVQNGHMSKITKSIFTEYTQMLNNNDLLDIYDKISDYEEPENIALENKLRHWLFSNIINPAYERTFYLTIDKYLTDKYRDEISCYLLQGDDTDWQNMSDDIFNELVKYYYHTHDNSLLTSMVVKKLEEKGEFLIKRGAFIYTKDFLKLFTQAEYSVKPLALPFPNSRSHYSASTIADICQSKPIMLTLDKNNEDECFEDLCDIFNWFSLDKACKTGNCHFRKNDFKNLVSALPELKKVNLNVSVMRSICNSLELIKQYSE